MAAQSFFPRSVGIFAALCASLWQIKTALFFRVMIAPRMQPKLNQLRPHRDPCDAQPPRRFGLIAPRQPDRSREELAFRRFDHPGMHI
jgi:hypothetical protein